MAFSPEKFGVWQMWHLNEIATIMLNCVQWPNTHYLIAFHVGKKKKKYERVVKTQMKMGYVTGLNCVYKS